MAIGQHGANGLDAQLPVVPVLRQDHENVAIPHRVFLRRRESMAQHV